uniref:Uncharacterized protein n=1 Tax=Setaria viridis TaxID=4556 RepID=A0A4U6UZZ2_SETVI|nr:hypothetical protein SEVIR_5G332450v2 [Setaria viridis]
MKYRPLPTPGRAAGGFHARLLCSVPRARRSAGAAATRGAASRAPAHPSPRRERRQHSYARLHRRTSRSLASGGFATPSTRVVECLQLLGV